jgi:hypothetical protein
MHNVTYAFAHQHPDASLSSLSHTNSFIHTMHMVFIMMVIKDDAGWRMHQMQQRERRRERMRETGTGIVSVGIRDCVMPVAPSNTQISGREKGMMYLSE